MGQNSGISWTDHTFNPWWGCAKISAGCNHCYAEGLAVGRMKLPIWGAGRERRMFGDKHWNEPVRWNAAAEKSGVRARVFCASMADVFENYQGPSAERVTEARERLWALIEGTPWLDWLLLTKRPENIRLMVPLRWGSNSFPKNLWLGCTVENQEMAEQRLPHLLSIPSTVRFVSYEPALGPVVFTELRTDDTCEECGEVVLHNALSFGDVRCGCGMETTTLHRLDWIIVGGESGNGARPFNPAWANETVISCQKAGVPVFVKQMGSNPILRDGSGWGPIKARKGDNLAEWSAQLRVQEFPR